MRSFLSITAISLLVGATALAEDVVVPLVALNAPGAYGNLWSTELYLVNTTDHAPDHHINVAMGRSLPLRATGAGPCVSGPTGGWMVPARTSLLVPPVSLTWELDCPSMFFGGLMLTPDPGIIIQSRTVNHKASGRFVWDWRLLSGFGSEAPAIPISELPSPGLSYMLPALVWDTSAGPRAFDTYLYVANPNGADATLTLASPTGEPLSMLLAGTEVQVPYTVTVPAYREVQLNPEPSAPVPIGGGPVLLDLAFSVSAPLAVIGTVVDRASNDSRPVLPLLMPPSS